MDNSAHKTTSKVSSLSITVGRAKINDHIYIHPSHNSTAYIPPPLGIDISSTLRILLQNLHGLQSSTISYSNNIAHTKIAIYVCRRPTSTGRSSEHSRQLQAIPKMSQSLQSTILIAATSRPSSKQLPTRGHSHYY
jgi:hypothetical protein